MLTVASIPAAHPYVSSVVDARAVTLLPDPVPPGATAPGQWWPPRLLEPEYLRGRLDEIDVVHVHFGFDSHSPEQLATVVDVLAERRTPLIVTVHDLQNPHFTDQSAHAARLDVLLPAATTVITLTDGAAAEIGRRWDRQAVVLPHPHVLPLGVVGARRRERANPVVGIHAKNLRANVDPWPLLDQLIDQPATDRCLRLDLDDEVLRAPRAAEAAAQRLDRYRRAGVDVRVHRRFTDQELADYLTEIDVLVLPYRHGTHSGWVEACHDAGVRAVVPDCGYFHRQHHDPVFGYGTGYFDTGSLVKAVETVVRSARASTAADPDRQRRRAEERQQVRETTTRLYHGAVA
ncbi:MAG: hypothetical protein ABWY93_06670 [Mycobacterium sp.]